MANVLLDQDSGVVHNFQSVRIQCGQAGRDNGILPVVVPHKFETARELLGEIDDGVHLVDVGLAADRLGEQRRRIVLVALEHVTLVAFDPSVPIAFWGLCTEEQTGA